MKPINTMLSAALAAILLAAPVVAETSQHVVLLIDRHEGNPARDTRYATMAVKTISTDVAQLNLQFGDKISLRAAGDPSPFAHLDWVVDDTFSHGGAEPRDVPAFVAQSLANLNQDVGHQGSDIIGALNQLSGSMECLGGTIFLVSNVIDAGRVEGDQFVYPSFPGAPFQGCEITLLGFAMNPGDHDIYTISAAKEVVTSILTAAGFQRVTIK